MCSAQNRAKHHSTPEATILAWPKNVQFAAPFSVSSSLCSPLPLTPPPLFSVLCSKPGLSRVRTHALSSDKATKCSHLRKGCVPRWRRQTTGLQACP